MIKTTNNKLESDGHYYWLDIIRFLAAFAVLACHFRGAFFEEYSSLSDSQHNLGVFSFYFITRLGFEAVLVFFVLSGFLVGGRAIKRLKDSTFKIKDYAIDRFVRIMLPLISSLLLYLPICLFFNLHTSVIEWIGSLLSLQGILTKSVFETLWSLSYEVWFYILIFAIAIVLTKRERKKLVIGVIILTVCMLVFVKLKVSYLFVWLMAACLYAFYRPSEKYYKGVTLFSFIISAIIIIMLQLSSNSLYLTLRIGNAEIIRDVLIVIFGLTFSAFVKSIIGFIPQKRFLIILNQLGTKLASFSYTLYLTHVPVLNLLRELGAPKSNSIDVKSVSLYILWITIAMIVAYVVYYIFERNTSVIKRQLKRYI